MVELDSRVRRYGEVTLVEVVVENDDEVPRRVRIASELDGAVWPPRTKGLPTAEWDGETLAVSLDPDERRSFGFASPAPPADPPVRIDEERAVADGGATVTAADVVRTLGDPRPPRDAVPEPRPLENDPGDDGGEETVTDDDAEEMTETGDEGSEDGKVEDDSARSDRRSTGSDRQSTGSDRRSTEIDDAGVGDATTAGDPDPSGATPPPAVRAWLSAVEAAVDVSDGGTLDPENGVVEPPDPSVLRAVSRRAASLADRASGAGDGEDATEGSP